MSIFGVPEKRITIEVNYIVSEGDIFIINDKNFVKDEFKDKIKTAIAEFDHEKWGDLNRIMKNSLTKDNLGDNYFDPISLRDNRLKNLLKKLTDGDGNEIIVNEKEIDSWDSAFCMALMTEYTKKVEGTSSGIFKDIFDASNLFDMNVINELKEK